MAAEYQDYEFDTDEVVRRMERVGNQKFGWTQTQLSLHITGMTNPSLVSGWKSRSQKGNSPNIQLTTLARAAHALQVHPFALLVDQTAQVDKVSEILSALETADEATLDKVLAAF